jgi:hypothetical protein
MLNQINNGKRQEEMVNRHGVIMIIILKMEKSTENFIIGLLSMIQGVLLQKVHTLPLKKNGPFL